MICMKRGGKAVSMLKIVFSDHQDPMPRDRHPPPATRHHLHTAPHAHPDPHFRTHRDHHNAFYITVRVSLHFEVVPSSALGLVSKSSF